MVRNTPKAFSLACMSLALCFGAAYAQIDWGLESGAASHGYITIASSPRSAALSGSGLADPSGTTDATWNPIAASYANNALVQGSQTRLSDRLGANYNNLNLIQPLGSVRILAGANFLDVDELDGRDEDGKNTGKFGSFAWGGRLGIASDSGAFVWGLQGMFNHFNLGEYDSRSALADAVLGYGVGPLRFAAGAFHFGWVEEFATEREYAPLTLQAGLSYKLALPGVLDWTVHTDLRRQTDGPKEVLLGVESRYTKVLVLRMGLDATADELAPSGGVGLNLGPVEASYAYQSNKALKGNHLFGLGYQF